ARLGRLFRHRLVRKDVDPDLAAALDLARHRDSRGLDLAVGQPAALQRLEPVLAELHLDLPARVPAPPSAVLLAMLDALGRQHQRAPASFSGLARRPRAAERPSRPAPPLPRPRPRPSRPARPSRPPPRPSRSAPGGGGALMSVRSAPV